MVVRRCLNAIFFAVLEYTSTRNTSAPIPGALYEPMYLSIASANGPMRYRYALTYFQIAMANGLSSTCGASNKSTYMDVLFIAEGTAPRGLREVRVMNTTTS